MTNRGDAEKVLRDYAGLTKADATTLVKAVAVAAEQETLALIAGSEPVPTNMGDARALRLRYISQQRQRSLSQREVEVIFRLSPSQAANTISRMQATYAQDVDGLIRARLKEAATAKVSGDAEERRYLVHFDDAATYEYAHQYLQRNHLDHDVRRRAHQTLDMPQSIADHTGTEHNPLTVLGIPLPK